MDAAEAEQVLGIAGGSNFADVRRAYRSLIRARHPDRAGAGSTSEAAGIIEAYAVLSRAHRATSIRLRRPTPADATKLAPGDIVRLDGDTIGFAAPADETFLVLLEAAHDIGELTYVDRSVPILEVICQFVGTPTSSLVITLQGRMDGTEAFCTVESIEARPGPPTADVVDVLVDLLHQRRASRET